MKPPGASLLLLAPRLSPWLVVSCPAGVLRPSLGAPCLALVLPSALLLCWVVGTVEALAPPLRLQLSSPRIGLALLGPGGVVGLGGVVGVVVPVSARNASKALLSWL